MQFGYELEFFGASLTELAQDTKSKLYTPHSTKDYRTFGLAKELGITDSNLIGGELISPIYQVEELKMCYRELKQKLKALEKHGAFIKKNSYKTGFHVHLDKKMFQEDWHRYQMFLQFFMAFQNEILDYAKGEHQHIRLNFYEHCDLLDWDTINQIISNDSYNYYYLSPLCTKRHCIRFTEETLEIRIFNSSLMFKTLKQFVDFSLAIADYIKKGEFDEELIEFYYQNYYNLGLNQKLERKKILLDTLNI